MQDTASVQSDTQEVAQSSEQTQQEEIYVNKSAEELAKRLKEVSNEAKVNRQKLVEEKRKREELEKQKLQDSGQYKELADIWQRKATESETQAKKLREAFALKTISDSVALEASKMGCVDPDVLVNLLPLEQVPIDETFSVDKASVKAMVEDVRKSKPYLFQKQAPKFADAVPTTKAEKPEKSIEKMDSKDIQKLLLEKFGK
jgi:hypothetical protein